MSTKITIAPVYPEGPGRVFTHTSVEEALEDVSACLWVGSTSIQVTVEE